MANTTMTMRVFMNEVINANINETLTEYAKEQIAKMDLKNEKKKETTTAKQKENLEFAEKILSEMETNRTYTAKELAEKYGVSTSKIAPTMKRLGDRIQIVDGYKPEVGKSKVKGYVKVEG